MGWCRSSARCRRRPPRRALPSGVSNSAATRLCSRVPVGTRSSARQSSPRRSAPTPASSAVCTIRSFTVGMPSGRRSRLPGLSIHTRLTGWGRYRPARSGTAAVLPGTAPRAPRTRSDALPIHPCCPAVALHAVHRRRAGLVSAVTLSIRLIPISSSHPCHQGGSSCARSRSPVRHSPAPGHPRRRCHLAVVSHLQHSRSRSLVIPHHTFLRPFAPPALPGFVAPMDALTPLRPSPQPRGLPIPCSAVMIIPSPPTRWTHQRPLGTRSPVECTVFRLSHRSRLRH